MKRYQLVMRTGPTPGKVFDLSEDELTLGREPGNEIAINDAEISRKHAHLSFRSGTYMLEDLGSTNGTFVNGQRLMGPHALRAGEIVSFGEQISCTYEIISEDDPNATIIASKEMAPPPGTHPTTPMAAPSGPPPPPPTAPMAQPIEPPSQPRAVPASPSMQPPSQPRSVPPPPGFAGKVPAGPAPQEGAAKPPKARSSRTIAIIAGVVVLCVVCGCIGFFVVVDQYESGVLWCRLFGLCA